MEIPKNAKFKDITNEKFGYLIVISYAGKIKKENAWLCKCVAILDGHECGNEKIVLKCNLGKSTTSCGCINNRKRSEHIKLKTKHNKTNSTEYMIWVTMKQRCYNFKNKQYCDYGGRGITVCDRWLGEHGFENFYEDMGPRQSKEYSIDRIDNNGNYCPENCRWTTMKIQSNNRRNSILLTYQDKTSTINEWANFLNVNYSLLYSRYYRGLTDEQILSDLS